jgi:hypothetical protein
MPRYRPLVTLAGAMLLLGGGIGLAFALLFKATPWVRIRGIIGGGVATYLGLTLIMAARSGHLPRWLTAIIGDPGDLD